MNQPVAHHHWRTAALSHIPLAGVLLILLYFALLDTPVLERFRTEQAFGWMVLLWIPLAILLGLVQLHIWLRWAVRHAPSAYRTGARVALLIVLAVFLSAAVLRYLS